MISNYDEFNLKTIMRILTDRCQTFNMHNDKHCWCV